MSSEKKIISTDEMIKSDKIWAGLNKPEMPIEDADIVVLGVPFDGGVSFRSGASKAPETLRSITFTAPPTTEFFEDISELKIKDLGDTISENRESVFRSVEEKIENTVSLNKFFTVLGGDHSITIPVLRGIDKALNQSFGVIHIDAHFDLCDTLEGDRLSHGSTERRALELKNIGSTSNQFFIGIRSIELDELEFLRNNEVNYVSASRFSEIGVDAVLEEVKVKLGGLEKIYITIDIDCLDPAYAAGTGTPQFGGLSSRELLKLLKGLFELPIIGFDVVEIAPSLDPSLTSVFAGRKIITECWGHYLRKKKAKKGCE